jgi:hypothetical protein
MADQVTGKIEPSVLGGADIYQFTLDGIATSAQMDRLIKLTEDLVKKLVGDTADSMKGVSAAARELDGALSKSADSAKRYKDAQEENTQELNKSSNFLRNIWTRNFSLALDEGDKALSLFTGALGFAYTGLTNYSKSLTEGLKRGVAGSTFDLAIAAKSAGVSLTTFTKALGESGGGFASLGSNATDGALQFGYLVKRVREATGSVGNLGLTNDELATLTAQQTKIAISQGFKGRVAQDVVIRNTRMLAEELDNLAARTGKSVLEMAQAAAKLSQDPIVANFIRSAKDGGREISAAVNSFAASMRGVFGEQGDKIASDALRSAMSGLPLIITQTGKNMILASNGIYSEIERQAQKARRNEKITEEDRQKLRDLALQEVKVRKDELNAFAMLGGPVGESATALLELAKEAEFYNSEEGKRQRRQSDAAKRFNTELNKLQASLQEAMIPFLQALNAVDWATVFNVVSYIPRKIAEFVEGFRAIINSFPPGFVDFLGTAADLLSKFGSGLIGILVTVGLVITGITIFNKTVGAVKTMFGMLGKDLDIQSKKHTLLGQAVDTLRVAMSKLTGRVLAADGTPGAGGRRGTTVIGGMPDLERRPGEVQGNKARRRAGLSLDDENAKRSMGSRAAQIRKENPGMTSAEAFERARAERAAEQSRRQTTIDRYGRQETSSIAERAAELRRQKPELSREEALKQARKPMERFKGTAGKIGEKMSSPKAMGFGMLAGVGLDIASGMAAESGNEKTARVLEAGSSIIGMAGTGAMIGSMIAPGVGTAVGAAIGGLAGGITTVWKNFLKDESGSMAEAVKESQLSAAEKAEKEVRDTYESQRKVLDELRALSEEISYGNQINARGVSYAASSERKLSDLRFNQG